jgi:hypothetical protein
MVSMGKGALIVVVTYIHMTEEATSPELLVLLKKYRKGHARKIY